MIGGGLVVGALGVVGWMLHHLAQDQERLSAGNLLGNAAPPLDRRESRERIKLLTSENAQLRAEIGSVKDRLETIERIVTDKPHRLAREIDALAIDKGGNA